MSKLIVSTSYNIYCLINIIGCPILGFLQGIATTYALFYVIYSYSHVNTTDDSLSLPLFLLLSFFIVLLIIFLFAFFIISIHLMPKTPMYLAIFEDGLSVQFFSRKKEIILWTDIYNIHERSQHSLFPYKPCLLSIKIFYYPNKMIKIRCFHYKKGEKFCQNLIQCWYAYQRDLK
jgi:hypothetical protein